MERAGVLDSYLSSLPNSFASLLFQASMNVQVTFVQWIIPHLPSRWSYVWEIPMILSAI